MLRQALAGMLWSQAVLPLRRRSAGSTATRQARRRRTRAGNGPQPRVDAPEQPRRHLDARHVGVPVVRGLGPRLPLRRARARRPGVREVAAAPALPRVVHAPERPAAGVRVGVLGDVNPPVHAWAALRVFEIDGRRRLRLPRARLPQAAPQLHVVGEPQGREGNNVFEGGFLGLDNIGPFDRSVAAGRAGALEQSDGTAWMAMYCQNLLEMALLAGRARPDLRGPRDEVLRALRADRDGAERQGPVGRGGRLLLRPAALADGASCRCARARSSACSRSRP